MTRRAPGLQYAVAATLLVTLTACGGSDSEGPDAVPTPTASSTASSPTASPTPSSTPTDDATAGGTADAPAPLTAQSAPLDWQPVDGSTDDAVTRSGDWELSVSKDGDSWSLVGPDSGGASSAPGWRVSDGLLDEDWAVVVLQDQAEEKPSRAEVTDLETGKSFTLDGRSDVPTTNGGTWALGDDTLVHATLDRGAYCLAEVDLETQRSAVTWCAPKRHGFNAAHVTDAGTALLTFDDSQPSCRTVASIVGQDAEPFAGATDCKAWEGLLTEDGAVWSTIPRERRIEEARYLARVGDGYFDLGPGVAGTLTACDGAAYFVRDPQQDGDPAALMRWTADDGLAVVYESPKGQAFLEQPRCGGDTMTVTALTSSGDEQVSADL